MQVIDSCYVICWKICCNTSWCFLVSFSSGYAEIGWLVWSCDSLWPSDAFLPFILFTCQWFYAHGCHRVCSELCSSNAR